MNKENIIINQSKWNSGKNVFVLLVLSIFFGCVVYKSFHEVGGLNFFEHILQGIEIILLIICIPTTIFFLVKMFSKKPLLIIKENEMDINGVFTKGSIMYKDISDVKIIDNDKTKSISIRLKRSVKKDLPPMRRLIYSYNLEKNRAEFIFTAFQIGDDFEKVTKIIKNKVK